MAKNYTAIPHGYLDECEALTDAEFGLLIRGLLRYSIDGTPIEAGGNARFFARRMMNQEDLNRACWERVSRKRAEAGRAGALARWRDRADADEDADEGADEDADEEADGNCQHKLS